MRRFFTAVLEQGNTYEHDFETEPYEAGWAREARWFIRILDSGDATVALRLHREISPDGLVWIADENAPLHVNAVSGHMTSCVQHDFGNWLRLRVVFDTPPPRKVKFLIYLALKE